MDQLTLFAVDTHAKTCPLQENNLALVERGRPYMGKCLGLLATVDQNTQFLKTSQGCLTSNQGDSLLDFSMIWPRSGMMRNGTVYQLQPLAPPTTEIASGLLLTPTAQSYKALSFRNPYALIRKNHADGNLQEQLMRVYQRMITPKCVEILMMYPSKWTDLNP